MLKDYKENATHLNDLLNEWDFIGVVPLGAKDEYDCLIDPVLKILSEGKDETDLSAYLKLFIKEHFGMELDQKRVENFSNGVFNWWNTKN